MENYNAQTFCLSKPHFPQHGDLVETTVESLLEPRLPPWPDNVLCETLQMEFHTFLMTSRITRTISDVTETEGTSLIKNNQVSQR